MFFEPKSKKPIVVYSHVHIVPACLIFTIAISQCTPFFGPTLNVDIPCPLFVASTLMLVLLLYSIEVRREHSQYWKEVFGARMTNLLLEAKPLDYMDDSREVYSPLGWVGRVSRLYRTDTTCNLSQFVASKYRTEIKCSHLYT